MNPALLTFAVVLGALHAAHQVGDHWLQTDHQAKTKGMPGWKGRIACATHVTTYTAAAVAALGVLVWQLGLELSVPATVVGLAISAITHYIADRREPLRRIAVWCRLGFYNVKGGGINGAYLLDQSWHVGWLFVASVVIAGGAA